MKHANNSFSLISSLIRGNWLMADAEVENYRPLVDALLRGESAPFEPRAEQPVLFYTSASVTAHTSPSAPRGDEGIAVFRIEGPVTKHGGACSYGALDYAAWIREASQNEHVKGLAIIYDCPGGQFDGIQTVVDELKAFGKPSEGFVQDGIAASGGYWMLAAHDKVTISHKSCMLGSIGALFNYQLSKEGESEKYIYSDHSPEKNYEHRELVKGNEKPLKENLLNPIAKTFIDGVKALRPQIGEVALKGKIFMGEQAIEVGLADRIGSFESVIESIQERTKNNKRMGIISNKFSSIMSFLGVSQLEASENNVTLENAHVDKLQVALQELETANTTITSHVETIAANEAALAAATTEKDTLQAQLTELTAEREQLQAENDRYKASTTRTPHQDDDLDEGEGNGDQVKINSNAQHYKLAESIGK